MNADTIELYFSDTSDLGAGRCQDCGSIDFEDTGTRVFCVRCGLVARRFFYNTASSELKV